MGPPPVTSKLLPTHPAGESPLPELGCVRQEMRLWSQLTALARGCADYIARQGGRWGRGWVAFLRGSFAPPPHPPPARPRAGGRAGRVGGRDGRAGRRGGRGGGERGGGKEGPDSRGRSGPDPLPRNCRRSPRNWNPRPWPGPRLPVFTSTAGGCACGKFHWIAPQKLVCFQKLQMFAPKIMKISKILTKLNDSRCKKHEILMFW